MRRLPPYHVPRERITDVCSGHRVVVIEAAGGYGKTVLGTELVRSWRSVGIEVELDYAGMHANLLAARLRAAVAQAGFTDAATVAGEGRDATATADAITSALAAERCAIVVDDAHNAAPDAAALIEHIASRLEADQRMLVLGRELPKGAERLRRAEYFHLAARDIAFSLEETLELCRSGFGIPTTAEGARALTSLTGGWTAATVLAVARAARTGESAEVVAASVTAQGRAVDALAAILEEPLSSLGPRGREQLAQVARLPLLDREVVDFVAGEDGFFDRALSAGVPFSPSQGTWWELPGPVRDHLARFASSSGEAMRPVADHYKSRGELGAALQLLIASGDPGEAAAVLAATGPEEAEGIDGLELQAVFEQLPDEEVNAHPNVLLLVARGHAIAFRHDKRAPLVRRAANLAARTGDAVLARAAAAEEVNDMERRFAYEECERVAREVLATAPAAEQYTRARCYYALARALRSKVYFAGRRDDAALSESEECLGRAADLYQRLGMRSERAKVLCEIATLTDFADGRAAAALARLDESLTLVANRPRRWGYLLWFRARVAAELGLGELSRASAQEMMRMAEQFDDDVLRAYANWCLAILASYGGDAEATLRHVREAEVHRADAWWGQASSAFLADAADALDRVGHTALAWDYLGRARSEPKDAGYLVALAGAALEARHGDPAQAEADLVAASEQPIDKREHWRVTLLRAFAALRRGDHVSAGALAARSFEEAARMGQPQLPLVVERPVAEQLIGLAVETGQPAASALKASSLPRSLAVLGCFALSEAGRSVPLGSGQEAKLLKFVAVNGGRVHAEQAIEALWPEAGRAAGRNRLRIVMSRLRSKAGDAVVRESEVLKLHDAVRLDLNDFLAEGRRARALAPTDLVVAAAVARGAMARYQGDVLPDDLYEDWAEKPRQNAKQMMLDLLDLCATDAARRGDLDALRRVVERTIEFDPYDDTRYLSVATALLRQGRRGEALTVVKRARSALAELGLEPSRQLVDLERSIVA